MCSAVEYTKSALLSFFIKAFHLLHKFQTPIGFYTHTFPLLTSAGLYDYGAYHFYAFIKAFRVELFRSRISSDKLNFSAPVPPMSGVAWFPTTPPAGFTPVI